MYQLDVRMLPVAPPPPPYHPSPTFECMGQISVSTDCCAAVFVEDCPPITCPTLGSLVQRKCLNIGETFHMAHIRWECDVFPCVEANAMNDWLTIYETESGVVLSSVLHQYFDTGLPFTNSPGTSNTCDRVIPLNDAVAILYDDNNMTRVYRSPNDYYAVFITQCPRHPPDFPPPLPSPVPYWHLGRVVLWIMITLFIHMSLMACMCILCIRAAAARTYECECEEDVPIPIAPPISTPTEEPPRTLTSRMRFGRRKRHVRASPPQRKFPTQRTTRSLTVFSV